MSRYISWARINTLHKLPAISTDNAAARELIQPDSQSAGLLSSKLMARRLIRALGCGACF
jgi:hypothetical protein